MPRDRADAARSGDVPASGMRLDKWLWAARFYKTRGLAVEAIEHGRVTVNGQGAKPAREVRPGDKVASRQGPIVREVQVLAIAAMRGPAPVAQTLYVETPESVAERERQATARRLGAADPAETLAHGRPTKRDRRQLADWTRWSASADDLPPSDTPALRPPSGRRTG
jgi:ribosome-associated heat shock protein Hsp15